MTRVAETLESHHPQAKSAGSYSRTRSSLRVVRGRYSCNCTDLVMNKIAKKALFVQK